MYKLFLISLLFSCHKYHDSKEFKEKFKNSNLPLQYLVCKKTVNTGSQDLYVIKGNISIPSHFLQPDEFFKNDILVCGNFPMEKIDFGSSTYSSHNKEYEIKGKVIDVIPANGGVSNIPLFYVTNWKERKATSN